MLPQKNSAKYFSVAFLAMGLALYIFIICWFPIQPKRIHKTCLDCHSELKDRYREGNIHQPVKEQNCESCHRPHGLIGGVYLDRAMPALCYKCHNETAESLKKFKTSHQPVSKGKCDLCHDPHNSPNPNLLNLQEDELCFNCHVRGSFQKKFIHEPVTEGCKTCHIAHGANFPELLNKEKNSLCQQCHEISQDKFKTQHGGYPVVNNCTDCHSVHSADNPALLKAVIHDPVADRQCQNCHNKSTDPNPFELNALEIKLCYSCHEKEKANFKMTSAHQPVKEDRCFECHRPHASDFSGMLESGPETLCFKCHEFNFIGPQAKEIGSGSKHPVSVRGECLKCHRPHIPAIGESHLLAEAAEKLCKDCHSQLVERPGTHPISSARPSTIHRLKREIV